jgi:hypothetical protein
MLEFRNTPRENGLSPAEMVFGHSLRSIIPAHRILRNSLEICDGGARAAGDHRRSCEVPVRRERSATCSSFHWSSSRYRI